MKDGMFTEIKLIIQYHYFNKIVFIIGLVEQQPGVLGCFKEGLIYNIKNKKMALTENTIIDLDVAISILDQQKTKLVLDKKVLELKNSDLNNKIRTSGRMPDFKYKNICDEQSRIKKDILSIERAMSDISVEISKKSSLRDQLRLELKGLKRFDVKSQLVQLRDKYIAFASDKTRVSSMRAMSAEFAENIEYIIKSLQ